MNLLTELLAHLFGHPPRGEEKQEVDRDQAQSQQERDETHRQQEQYRRAMVRYLGIEADVVRRRRCGTNRF